MSYDYMLNTVTRRDKLAAWIADNPRRATPRDRRELAELERRVDDIRIFFSVVN